MSTVPAGGGTHYLADRVGRNGALELVPIGEALDAGTAASCGSVNRAVPADELDAFFDQLAHNISHLADRVAGVKRILAGTVPLVHYQSEKARWLALISQLASLQRAG